ncbi:MAG: MotA/TolQ/ExbB proton channel family protein [Spirochaetales bacterium]|nr:MotA/TolQ/ExbB proton channel family protein [Spirochaetales bacterium]
MTLKEFIELGGWAMWPLIIFSIATVSLIIEKAISILVHNLKVDDIHAEVIGRISRGQIKEAMEFLASFHRRKKGAVVLLAGLSEYQLGTDQVEKAIQTSAAEQLSQLENGFDLLVALGSIAPITGFLGTVSGMIGAFQSIANAAEVNAQLVAGGIFEALITTAFGLSIAIVAIAGYNLFAHIVDRFSSRIENTGSQIIMQLNKLDRQRQGVIA